jgi:hypothetical protein
MEKIEREKSHVILPKASKKSEKILLKKKRQLKKQKEEREKFINTIKLIQKNSVDLNKRTGELKHFSQKNTIKLENNRNIQIYKIISEDQTNKDLLEELKSS